MEVGTGISEGIIPSALLRSARPLRRPAASALCFSRSFSRSRASLSRVLRLPLPLLFFELASPTLWLTSTSSSESAFEREFLLFRGDEEEPEFVRCRLMSSLRLFGDQRLAFAIMKTRLRVGMASPIRERYARQPETHSSLSLRLLLPRRILVSTLAELPCFLLSSMALRSCSASS